MPLKFTKSKKKSFPVKCLFCGNLLGWIRFEKTKMIYCNIFLRQVSEIETKTFEVFCSSCGQGIKISSGKKSLKTKK